MNYELIIKEQEEITPDLTLLDTSELDRYQRFTNPQKKLSFLTGQTVLKQVLANRLGISPASVSFALTPMGKPYLPALAETTMPFFNLSHSEGHYLIGLASCPIGVDMELPKSIDLTNVRHFLTPHEYEQIKVLPKSLHSSIFYRLFTTKEAFLKATDKWWALDTVRFQLENHHWALTSPGESFQFYQRDYKGHYIAVCLDMTVITTQR